MTKKNSFLQGPRMTSATDLWHSGIDKWLHEIMSTDSCDLEQSFAPAGSGKEVGFQTFEDHGIQAGFFFSIRFVNQDITGPLPSVWKEWVSWCVEFGVDAPYDWRLAGPVLEERDPLRLTFETLRKLRGGPRECAKTSAPFLGAPDALKGVLSGVTFGLPISVPSPKLGVQERVAQGSSGSTDLRRAPQDERGQISQLSAAASQAASEQHAFDPQRIRAGARRFQADQAGVYVAAVQGEAVLFDRALVVDEAAARCCHKNLLTSTHIKNSSSAAAMVQEPLEDKMEAPPPVEDNVVPLALEISSPEEQGVCFGKPNDVGPTIWNPFRPSENRIIEAEASIDVNKHRNPENFSDQFLQQAIRFGVRIERAELRECTTSERRASGS
ncbi:hypothetical protein SELMODRAFT_430865 [Selaginella moellendorffii]|uniref:Uncharacterized protein n=1 Tax=Selaginella moellendorffii TaxID=88036 RepID=D8TAS1_SELML|nr:hypothetical protein SELMODRAFT_430865 [Selaginella moellendorffii]